MDIPNDMTRGVGELELLGIVVDAAIVVAVWKRDTGEHKHSARCCGWCGRVSGQAQDILMKKVPFAP